MSTTRYHKHLVSSFIYVSDRNRDFGLDCKILVLINISCVFLKIKADSQLPIKTCSKGEDFVLFIYQNGMGIAALDLLKSCTTLLRQGNEFVTAVQNIIASLSDDS